jgi:hypothetical protein
MTLKYIFAATATVLLALSNTPATAGETLDQSGAVARPY